MNSDKELSVVIVNWNTKKFLLDCLEALLASLAAIDAEVFVVDNASTDASVLAVRNRFADITIIENERNLGFAAGNNVALREARGEYLLLLNPDTLVTPDAVPILLQVMQSDSELGAVGAQLLYADGSYQASSGFFPNIWSEIPVFKRLANRGQQDRRVSVPWGEVVLKDVDWVSGACLMVRRSVVDQVGTLDEDYWLYTEETDWCFMMRGAGWRIATVSDALVVHFEKAASKQRYVETTLHFYLSRIMFNRKNRGMAAASFTRLVFLVKSIVWLLRPSISPLQKAHADLDARAIRQAYRRLLITLLLPARLAPVS
jgi:N-acetylglucosaminyl-diphospho-decaprenol L-rhamnosyltransferase